MHAPHAHTTCTHLMHMSRHMRSHAACPATHAPLAMLEHWVSRCTSGPLHCHLWPCRLPLRLLAGQARLHPSHMRLRRRRQARHEGRCVSVAQALQPADKLGVRV